MLSTCLALCAGLLPALATEVQEYVNALRLADRQPGRLVEALQQRPDSAILVVLGDHLPPITSGVFQRLDRELASAGPAEQAERRRRVPLPTSPCPVTLSGSA